MVPVWQNDADGVIGWNPKPIVNHDTPVIDHQTPGNPALSGLTALQCPEPPLTLPFGSLRAPNALPLVGGFEPAELFGVHGLERGCPELAVGRWSRRELRLRRLADL